MKALYINGDHVGDSADFDTTGLPDVLTGVDQYGDRCTPMLRGVGSGVQWEVRDADTNALLDSGTVA